MMGLKEKPLPLPPAGFARRGERVWLLCSHQFWLPCLDGRPRGACLSGRPSGRSRTAAEAQAFSESRPRAFGALSPKLCRLFFDSLRALSGQAKLSAARAVGKFGLPFALAQMVLEKGAGFRLDPNFPLPLWEERLYEAIACLPPSEEEKFRQQTESLGLEAVFLGETTKTSDLVLHESKISFQEMSAKYYTPWEGSLSL